MACIQRGESVIRYTMLSARAKGKADFALIAQGRKVMRNPKITEEPEDNTLSHKWKKCKRR